MNKRWLALCGSTAILAGGVLALAVPGPFGTPPRVLPYGGTLEQDGVAVNGNVPMTFFLLTGENVPLASAIWSEDYPANNPVAVAGGRFQVELGSRTPNSGIPDAVLRAGELYVGVRVAGVELSGRQRLFSNPFAITAAQAQDFTVHATLQVGGDIVRTAANGNVAVSSDKVLNDSGDEYLRLRTQLFANTYASFAADKLYAETSVLTTQTGDVRMGSDYAPRGQEELRIIRGTVTATGNIGVGFTSTGGGTASQAVTFTRPFSATPSVVCSVGPGAISADACNTVSVTAAGFTSTTGIRNVAFVANNISFIAIGPD